MVLEGEARVGERVVVPGELAYLGQGREQLALTARDDTRVLLVGGEPFEAPIIMFWNFVARTREEVAAASEAWASGDDRFGRVASELSRIPAPPVPWQR